MIQKIKRKINLLTLTLVGRVRLQFIDPSYREIIKQIKRKRLTYLSDKKLINIVKTAQEIERKGLKGLFIEAGCALGGSTILISKLKNKKRVLNVYDVFDMIPAPTENDPDEVHDRYKKIAEGKSAGIKGDVYYGYQDKLYDLVLDNIKSFDIEVKEEHISLIKGLLQDTMVVDESVALAHIDVDWYDPVFVSLERIFPNLVVGGSIILDDYYDWGGCKKATDEYLLKVKGEYIKDGSSGAMRITRIK